MEGPLGPSSTGCRVDSFRMCVNRLESKRETAPRSSNSSPKLSRRCSPRLRRHGYQTEYLRLSSVHTRGRQRIPPAAHCSRSTLVAQAYMDFFPKIVVRGNHREYSTVYGRQRGDFNRGFDGLYGLVWCRWALSVLLNNALHQLLYHGTPCVPARSREKRKHRTSVTILQDGTFA